MRFALHPQLARDCVYVGDLLVCRVLLMNDRRFPWLILVPRREGLREIFELNDADYHTVMSEVRRCAQSFSHLVKADKMNVAALGNMVPQLHIHIIARRQSDAAWPRPVWGVGAAEPYDAASLPEWVASMVENLGLS